ncbi:hypothetical protein TRVA0_013S02102 [Trichomonascus vanleenenianus]|uniref:MoaD/ThiS family protein n=1 Tax=Trichomonascus vanleenenianus TaxID=2268995 RepID=UPI003ECB983E
MKELAMEDERVFQFLGRPMLMEVVEVVRRWYPMVGDLLPSCQLAVNEEYTEDMSETLHDNDEIAFIPPVSSG